MRELMRGTRFGVGREVDESDSCQPGAGDDSLCLTSEDLTPPEEATHLAPLNIIHRLDGRDGTGRANSL